MSILNITNLTDNPRKWIEDKFNSAFEEVEKEFDTTIDESKKYEFIDGEIENLIERAEETKGKDLFGLIDNYLVNLDYYAVVKEWYEGEEN